MLLLNYNENYGHFDNIFTYNYLLTYLLTYIYIKKRFRMCEKKYLATHHTDFTFIFLHTSFHDDIW